MNLVLERIKFGRTSFYRDLKRRKRIQLRCILPEKKKKKKMDAKSGTIYTNFPAALTRGVTGMGDNSLPYVQGRTIRGVCKPCVLCQFIAVADVSLAHGVGSPWSSESTNSGEIRVSVGGVMGKQYVGCGL